MYKPPKLLSKQSNTEIQKIIKIGSSVSLECPVERLPTEEIYFEWYKNGQQIEYFDKRVRITNSGVLKIKNANPEDTGRFMCRAINGFGSVDFTIILIVMDLEYHHLYKYTRDHISKSHESDDNESEKDVHKILDLDVPSMTRSSSSPVLLNGWRVKCIHSSSAYSESNLSQMNKYSQHIITRKTGSGVRFKCVDQFIGNLKPTIIWFHNSEQFSDSEPRKGRNSLVINDLKPEDSGNYTCVSTHQTGSISRSYVLKVIDTYINKPQIEGIHPINTSAIAGSTLTLHCSVKSEELPHIQWLKKIDVIIDYGDDVKDEESQHYIKVMGEVYKIVASDQIGGQYKSEETQMNGIMSEDILPVPIVVAFVSPEPNTRITESVYESPAKCTRCVPSEGSHTYNQMVTNKSVMSSVSIPTMPSMPSSELRSSSPFYSEITSHDKRIANAYQMYTNPQDFKPNNCHPNKPYESRKGQEMLFSK
ncbi:unnamed protein product [Medioppia subpectinata]|uniref:Ig-like domain-containing protein n=1 Tax=Medioppia subpectinata TaxID=1979941 RepID=A0A7R9KSZ8_9ACAR|nr:unnamed protein product [Medioppia subpectinata]CAG2108882.1 unnamed protein product [Medioppia subpectinata]